MKKLTIPLIAVAALTQTAPAYAMTYYLVRQWFQGANQYCQYSNGSVLVVNGRACPTSIQG